jgi:polynucleotide 5'-hydroxyl-kinase GRC3/NOL9
VVINTTGLATGSIGRALKSQKIAAVMPDNIIAIEYGDELKYLDMYEKMGINVMHLPVFTGVRQKSKNERIQLRQASFYEHFFYAETIEAPFHYTGFERTLINNGECINVNRMFPDHPDIAYAEKGANEAVVILDRPIKNIMSVLKPLETRNITLYRSSDLNRLLTGLIDSNGVFKGLGIIRSINFRDRLITIFSRAESFSCIQFGSIKIDENDFSYKGSLTPDTLKLY